MTAALCIANLITKAALIDNTSRYIITKWAKETKKVSQEQYCPVDTGATKNSYELTTEKNTLTEFFVRITVGKDLDYPNYVHEIPYSHVHGQWKFLSTPFNNRSPSLMNELLDAGRRIL